jgi:hypothetical protein
MTAETRIVIYSLNSRVINKIIEDWNFTPNDPKFNLSSYTEGNSILFNDGFNQNNIISQLISDLNAKLDIYLPDKYDLKLPNWIIQLGSIVNIITVPIEASIDLPISVPNSVHSSSKSETAKDKTLIIPKKKAQSKKKQSTKQYTEDQANSILKYFDVNITGARDGDTIIGVADRNSKTIIRIHGDSIRPKAKELNALRQHPIIWKKFIDKLEIIPFFSPMSRSQREEWLEDNENDKDDYIGDESDNFHVELLQPGQGDLISDEVDSADLEALMEGNPNHPQKYWSSQDIIDIIPAKPGSKGLSGRHVLFWNKNWWKLIREPKTVDSFSGLIFDLHTGETLSSVSNSKQKLIILDDITLERSKPEKSRRTKTSNEVASRATWHTSRSGEVGFLTDNEMMGFTWTEVSDIIFELCEWFTGTQKELSNLLDLIKANFEQYTAATYKSLMQKNIRFRAETVALFVNINVEEKETLVDTRLVILATMGALLINPGSFVPDIQRYVSGLESLTKRLAVTIVEDASIDDPRKLQSLLAAALLAQRSQSWRPSRTLVKKWFKYGLEAWERSEKYVFDNHVGLELHPFFLSSNNTPFQNCSALIDELRSFEGDIAMIRYIAAHYSEATRLWGTQKIERIPIMPIYHHIDQHSFTSLPWYVNPGLIEEIASDSDQPASVPFSSLFYRLFSEDTGFNPRPPGHLGRTRKQKTLIWDEADDFISAMSTAQRIVLRAKQLKQKFREIKGTNSYTLEYKLDTAWLTALVGSIEIKGSPPVIITLDAKDPLNMIVVRRPARQMKDEPLSAEREEESKEEARLILQKGVKLKAVSAPCEHLTNAIVYLRSDNDADYYVVEKDGKEQTWEDARTIKLHLPYHQKLGTSTFEYNESDLSLALLNIGNGIQVDAWDDLTSLCKNTNIRTIQRVLFYISSFKASFELNPIGRSGGGTKGSVTIEDVSVNQFLLQLSLLFPAAVRPVEHQPGKFSSPIPPLLWTIRNIIKDTIESDSKTINWNCSQLWDRNKRTLWEHQESSIQEMIDNHTRGSRGIFLYQPPGLGKTIQVLYYLKWLAEKIKLPKYVIYSLPSSAIKSVSTEILAMGFEVILILPIKGKKVVDVPDKVKISRECEIKPGVITLIEHDYLRRCEEELLSVATNSIIVFDEVHKMLRESQRTNISLQLSRLSKEFTVLTGTPVIDNRIYRLIPWLEQIVPVEINEANFWVAAATMVSRKASTGIKTKHEYIEAQFSASEEKKYKKLVPPGLGGSNTTSRLEQIKDATTLSYKVCNREMINQTIGLINEGIGVMMVAATEEHQNVLRDMLIEAGVKSKRIFCLTNKQSLFLTDEAVKSKSVPKYKVVITTVRHNAGYTLTYLGAFVSSIYPSNQSSRDQLEGRINRIGSTHSVLQYIYIHCGTLTYILNNHDQARSLAIAISDMASEIGAK